MFQTIKNSITYFHRGFNYSIGFAPQHGRKWILCALYDGLLDSIDYREVPSWIVFSCGSLLGLLFA